MTEYRVTSPVRGYAGEIGGVGFHKGAATVTSDQRAELAYFRRKGFVVEEIPAPVEPKAPKKAPAPKPPKEDPKAGEGEGQKQAEGDADNSDPEGNAVVPPIDPETDASPAKGGKKK